MQSFYNKITDGEAIMSKIFFLLLLFKANFLLADNFSAKSIEDSPTVNSKKCYALVKVGGLDQFKKKFSKSDEQKLLVKAKLEEVARRLSQEGMNDVVLKKTKNLRDDKDKKFAEGLNSYEEGSLFRSMLKSLNFSFLQEKEKEKTSVLCEPEIKEMSSFRRIENISSEFTVDALLGETYEKNCLEDETVKVLFDVPDKRTAAARHQTFCQNLRSVDTSLFGSYQAIFNIFTPGRTISQGSTIKEELMAKYPHRDTLAAVTLLKMNYSGRLCDYTTSPVSFKGYDDLDMSSEIKIEGRMVSRPIFSSAPSSRKTSNASNTSDASREDPLDLPPKRAPARPPSGIQLYNQ